MKRPANFGGVTVAVSIRWQTTSRTVHPVHSDGASQSAAGSAASASACAARSNSIICQVSTTCSRPPVALPV